MGQVNANLKFELVVGRLHVGAKLVEGFVVTAFAQVGEFMDDDHFEKLDGGVFKQAGDTQFTLAFQTRTLYAGNGGVRPEGVLNDMQFAVVSDLANGLGAAQGALFEFLRVGVERPVGAQAVALWVFRQQPVACPLGREYLANFVLRFLRVALQVAQRNRSWREGHGV